MTEKLRIEVFWLLYLDGGGIRHSDVLCLILEESGSLGHDCPWRWGRLDWSIHRLAWNTSHTSWRFTIRLYCCLMQSDDTVNYSMSLIIGITCITSIWFLKVIHKTWLETFSLFFTCVRLMTPFGGSRLGEGLQAILRKRTRTRKKQTSREVNNHHNLHVYLLHKQTFWNELWTLKNIKTHPVGVERLQVGDHSVSDRRSAVTAFTGCIAHEGLTCGFLCDGGYTGNQEQTTAVKEINQ